MEKIKVRIIKSNFMKDGKFDREESIKFGGRLAGICYNKDDFDKLEHESIEKTNRRVDLTINNGHHSVYDHDHITIYIKNIPKVLAMVINNEKEYTTSEKSARYTPIIQNKDSIITDKEVSLYNKWMDIFKLKIKEQYGDIFDDKKIEKLAQENARYLITVFMPTKMAYTTSLRQFNYLASWLHDYSINQNGSYLEKNLSEATLMFLSELERLNILDERLMKNEKNRKLSLFGSNLKDKEDIFTEDIYSVNYKGSWAYLAQAQRHRTLSYRMERLENLTYADYFIPPIIKDNMELVYDWLYDINSVSNVIPQGELIRINERGNYEDFILKCQERLCSSAQLEIFKRTRGILLQYKQGLININSNLQDELDKYTKGCRCSFGYECTTPCKSKIRALNRKI